MSYTEVVSITAKIPSIDVMPTTLQRTFLFIYKMTNITGLIFLIWCSCKIEFVQIFSYPIGMHSRGCKGERNEHKTHSTIAFNDRERWVRLWCTKGIPIVELTDQEITISNMKKKLAWSQTMTMVFFVAAVVIIGNGKGIFLSGIIIL